MITKLAVRWLIRQLRKDKALWYAYQANIAMTIYDAYQKYMPLTTSSRVSKSAPAVNKEYPLCPRCETPTVAGAHMTSNDKRSLYCVNGNCNYDVAFDSLTTPILLNADGGIKDASPDPLNKDYSPTLHEFCNICANDFLKLLTK